MSLSVRGRVISVVSSASASAAKKLRIAAPSAAVPLMTPATPAVSTSTPASTSSAVASVAVESKYFAPFTMTAFAVSAATVDPSRVPESSALYASVSVSSSTPFSTR